MTYDIHGTVLPEQSCAAVRATLPVGALPGWVPEALGEVAAYLGSLGLPPSGPPFARYAFHDDLADVEAGFPVAASVPAQGRVTSSSLPAGPVAVTTHHGHYEELALAYKAVLAWLEAHGTEPAGPHWEIYYTDPQAEPDPARWRTDLVVPYQAT